MLCNPLYGVLDDRLRGPLGGFGGQLSGAQLDRRGPVLGQEVLPSHKLQQGIRNIHVCVFQYIVLPKCCAHTPFASFKPLRAGGMDADILGSVLH